MTEPQALSRVLEALDHGRGGLLVTPNLFILRSCATTVAPQLVNEASLVLVDGAPLVWAARLQRTPVAARIPGASFTWTLCAAAERTGRSVFLLGGLPGAAERTSEVLLQRFPRLRLVGHECPPMGFEHDPGQMVALTRRLIDATPDMVFVALGFPKQEQVSTRLAESLPGTWFFCCGASLDFASGMRKRAPAWMQRAGFEWAYRAMTEPRRLGPRYLRDAGYGLRLLSGALWQRVRSRSRTTETGSEFTVAR